MKDTDKLELIEKYLEGSLSGEQLLEVENRINSDAAFSKEVEWQRKAMERLGDPSMRLFQQQLQAYRQEGKLEKQGGRSENKVIPINRGRRWMAIAASVVVLAVAGIWIFQQGQLDIDKLYADSYAYYPDKISAGYNEEIKNPPRRGLIESRKLDFVKAMKTYPKNVALLEAHIEEYPEDNMAHFYLAQAYLESGNLKKADEILLALKNNPDFAEHGAANWYLALSNLKQGKVSNSKKLLLELVEGDSIEYKEKATLLLGKLDKTAAPFFHESNKLYKQGNFIASLAMIREALMNIRKAENPSQKVDIHYHAAKVEMEFGNFQKADELLKKANHQFRNEDQTDSPEYAKVLSFQALSHVQQAQYRAADSLLEIAALIQEKTIGKKHPDYATTLHWMGLSKFEQRKPEKALPFYLNAKNIREKTPGTSSLEYAISLDRLAEYYAEDEQDSLALAFCEEALSIVGEHAYKNRLLNTLGRVYQLKGDNLSAIKYFTESQELQEQLGITTHPHYGLTLSNKGFAASDLGRKPIAIKSLERSISVFEKSSKNHPNYARALNNLADLYSYEDSTLEAAGSMFDMAASIFLKHDQQDHFLEASTNAATILRFTENHDVALSNFKKIIQSKGFSTLNNYAQAYTYKNYSEAIWWEVDTTKYSLGDSMIRLGEKIFLQSYPPTSLNYLDFAGARAEIAEMRGDTILSSKFYKRNCQQLTSMLADYYPMMNEEERLYFYGEYQSYFPQFAKSFAVRHPKGFPSLYRKLLELQTAAKGASLQISLDQRRNRPNTADPEYDKLMDKYIAIRRQLAQALLYANQKSNNEIQLIDSLKTLANTIESQLSTHSQNRKTRLNQTNEQITFEKLQEALQADEVLVDFMVVDYYNPLIQKRGDSIFCALVCDRNSSFPQLVPLSKVEQIAELFAQIYRPDSIYISDPTLNHQLYKAIWQPLEPYVDKAKRIYISPEGSLHQLPFHTLFEDSHGEKMLIEKYDIRYLLSPSDLLRKRPAPTNRRVALMGGAIFDSLKTQPQANPIASRGGYEYLYLKHTEEEVEELKTLFQQKKWRTKLMIGEDVLEANFRNLCKYGCPSIIHLATHAAYFQKDTSSLKEKPTLEERVYASDDPMIRSLILLAGANVSWKSRDTLAIDSDGILTAFEVSNMDLSGTDMLVLSACESATGELRKQEGVFGLQRAFRLAGVRSLLVSLWAVPDKQTKELMIPFYQYYLNGDNAATALRKAQLDMSKKYEPYDWAAFVLLE